MGSSTPQNSVEIILKFCERLTTTDTDRVVDLHYRDKKMDKTYRGRKHEDRDRSSIHGIKEERV